MYWLGVWVAFLGSGQSGMFSCIHSGLSGGKTGLKIGSNKRVLSVHPQMGKFL